MAENTAKAEAMLVTSAKPKRADAPKTKAAPAVAGGMLLKKPRSSGFLNGLVIRKTAGGAIKPKATTKPNAPPAKKIASSSVSSTQIRTRTLRRTTPETPRAPLTTTRSGRGSKINGSPRRRSSG